MARMFRKTQMEQPRVLVIEDDFMHIGELSATLVESGMAVVIEEDVIKALQRLFAEPWALVVADAELLGVDGLVLLEMARELTDTLFLLILGEDERSDQLRAAQRVCAARILAKPLNPSELQGLAWELIASGPAVSCSN